MKKNNNNILVLEFLEEGEYIGRIESTNLSMASDGVTQFLNISIVIDLEDSEEEIQVSKAYITNLGRNRKLREFLQSSEMLNRHNEVNLENLIGMDVVFTIEYDENGKLIVGELEEYIDFADGEDD